MSHGKPVDITSILSLIERKAEKGAVQVEDLLKIVAIGDAHAIPVLRKLKAVYAWPDDNRIGRKRVVPLGLWVNAICNYLAKGIYGFVNEITLNDSVTPTVEMAFDIIKEVRTPESVEGALQIWKRFTAKGVPQSDVERDMSVLICDTLNELLCFKPVVVVTPAQSDEVKCLLHIMVQKSADEAVLSSAYCALRAVGDQETIKLIQSKQPLKGQWKGVEQIAIKAIKGRLRKKV